MAPEKKDLLLVDDDADVVWALGRRLIQAGFSVVICGDGAEAVQLLEEKHFDILVTDLQLPYVNGLALMEWVVNNRPTIQIVVITAFGSPSVKQVSLGKGAVLYLEKPVDTKFLIDFLSHTPKTSSFSGNIRGIDLFDYVQLMLISRRRVVLEILSHSGEKGSLFLDQGDVLHAVCGSKEGEEAFYHCLAFEGGSFSALPWNQPSQQSIHKSGEFLLMEAARQKDENNRQTPLFSQNQSKFQEFFQ